MNEQVLGKKVGVSTAEWDSGEAIQYNSTTAVLETSAVVNALSSERPLDTRRRTK